MRASSLKNFVLDQQFCTSLKIIKLQIQRQFTMSKIELQHIQDMYIVQQIGSESSSQN